MLPHQTTPETDPRPDPFRWSRTEATRAIHDFHNPDRPSPSQRQFARDSGLPRSTLGDWLRRGHPAHPDLEPELVAFLDSPAGYRFLRRLVAVALFVRSSSCVEGRNGRLSLYHHGQGPLSESRLRSLTAVHNYVVERADGTTAAERFFGSKPEPVFEWLLERMPELPRPAQKRPAGRHKATPAA